MDLMQVLDRVLLQINNGGAECEIYLVGGDVKHRLPTRPLGPLLDQLAAAREQFSPEAREIVLAPRSTAYYATPKSGGWMSKIFGRSKSDKKKGRKTLDEGEAPMWFTRATAETALHLLASLELLEQPARLARDLAQVREKAQTAEPYERASLETSAVTFEREFAKAMLVANCAGYHTNGLGPVRSFAAEFGADRLRLACEAFETECSAALRKLPTKATKQVEKPPESWPANQIPILKPGSFENPEGAPVDTAGPSDTRDLSEEASGVKPPDVEADGPAREQDAILEVPQPSPHLKKPEALSGFLVKPVPSEKDSPAAKMRSSWARMLGVEADSEGEESGKAENSTGHGSERRDGSTAVTRAGGEMNGPDNGLSVKPSEVEAAARPVSDGGARASPPGTHARGAPKSPSDEDWITFSENATPEHTVEMGSVEEQFSSTPGSKGTADKSRAEKAASDASLAPISSPSLPTFKSDAGPMDNPLSWSGEPQIRLARDCYGSGQHAAPPGRMDTNAETMSAAHPEGGYRTGGQIEEGRFVQGLLRHDLGRKSRDAGRRASPPGSASKAAAPKVNRLWEAMMAPLAGVRSSGSAVEKSYIFEAESEQTEAGVGQTGGETPLRTDVVLPPRTDVSTAQHPFPEGLSPARSYAKPWQNQARSSSPKTQAPDVSNVRRESMPSYKERREAKMREQEERIRAEHEAKLRAMEDALEKRKAEMLERSQKSALLALSAAERRSALEALNASTDSTEAKERAIERLQRPTNHKDEKSTPPAGNRVNLLLAKIVSMVGSTSSAGGKQEASPNGKKSSSQARARSPSVGRARPSQRILELANPRSQTAPRRRSSEAERALGESPRAASLKKDDMSRSSSPARTTFNRTPAKHSTPLRTSNPNLRAERVSPSISVATTPRSNASPYPSPRGPLSGRYSPERGKPRSALGYPPSSPSVKRAASVPARRKIEQKNSTPSPKVASFNALVNAPRSAPPTTFGGPPRSKTSRSASISSRYPPSPAASSRGASFREEKLVPERTKSGKAREDNTGAGASLPRPQRSSSPTLPTRTSTDSLKPRWSSGLRVTVADSPSLANGRVGNRTVTPASRQNERSTSRSGSFGRSSLPTSIGSSRKQAAASGAPLQKESRPPPSRSSLARTSNPGPAQKWVNTFRSPSAPRATSASAPTTPRTPRTNSVSLSAKDRLLSQTKASQAKVSDRAAALERPVSEAGSMSPQLRNRREWKSFVGPVQIYAAETTRPVRRRDLDVRSENEMLDISVDAVEKTVQSVQPIAKVQELAERLNDLEREMQERERAGNELRERGRMESAEQLFGEEIGFEGRPQRLGVDTSSQDGRREHLSSSPKEQAPAPKSRKRWEEQPVDPRGKKGALAKLGRFFSRRSSKTPAEMSTL